MITREKHRTMMLKYFEFNEGSRGLGSDGGKDGKEEEWEKKALGNGEAKEFRGLAATLFF